MENRCSFGIILNSNCISRRKNEQIDIDDLSLMEVELIKLRSAIANFSEVTGICQHHKYVRDYSSNFRKHIDPLNIHQNIVKSNLHVVTLEEYKQITQYEVLPGQKICRNCVKTIFKTEDADQNDDVEEVMTGDSDQMSVEAATELVSDSLEMLECSPLKTLRSNKILKLGKKKIKSTISKLRNTIVVTFNEPQLASSKNECDNWARFVMSIKEKLVSSNRERKIQLLTLVPHDWSVV